MPVNDSVYAVTTRPPAERLREWGIDAKASRQATRGEHRNRDALWRIKAKEEGRQHSRRPSVRFGASVKLSREESLAAWKQIAIALANSALRDDRVLAKQIVDFVKDVPMPQRVALPPRDVGRTRDERAHEQAPQIGTAAVKSTRVEPQWER